MDGNLATTSGNHDSDSFIGRDYQVQLLSIAEKENTILFLPTGSGKTFVAVMLIKSMSKDLEKPYREGGKRTFFAVNTVALVTQQGDYIARHTHLSVGKYSGDLNVDNWNANRWEEELNKNQVIVLTCQILLDMLCHGFIWLESINLIIFDECHHAVADHCMRRVMQKFEKCPKEQQPRVLGLSATLLNSNCKASNVRKEIETLEITFQSKVATVDDINQVKRFSTNPVENIIMFNEGYPETAASCVASLKADVMERLKAAIMSIRSVDPSVFSLDKEKPVTTISPKLRRMNASAGEKERKRLGSILNDVQVIVEDLGIFAGYVAALYANILLHRRKLSMNTAEGKLIISSLITHVTVVRKIIHDKIEQHDPLEQVFKFSTTKVLKLIDLINTNENPVACGKDSMTLEKLLQQKKESLTSKPSCLIFVERRQTAKTLYQVLKHVAQHSVQLKNVRPDFVVGIASNPASMESAASVRSHHEAIKRFRLGECNYLIASDVMEEGVDIPLCSMVVKLDLPKTFRSYVQSKGRARHSSSKFFMFVSTSNAKFEKNLEEYRRIEVILKQILVGKSELREGPSEEDVKYNLYCQDIPPYYSDDNSSSVSTTSASSLINRYCSLLPQDKFTQLQPIWALQECCVPGLSSAGKLLSNNRQENMVKLKLAFLQLPINSPLRNVIKGVPMPSKRLAKRAVAIIACVILHRQKELGKNDLLPVCHKPEALDDAILFPHWIDEKDSGLIPGTKKAKRMYQKESSKNLSCIHPKPEVPTYVYHIFQTPTFDAPSPKDSRGTAIYHVLNMKRGYAILSSKKLPQVCDFSIYMSSGEIAVTIEPEHEEIILSANEIEELELFHAMLFLDLLNICKQFFIVDKTDNENAYLIAPTCAGSDGKWIIDWDIVKNFPLLPPVLPLSLQDKENLKVDDENFLYEVVTPWYRGCYAEQHYVVTQVCEDLTSRSEFPSKTYESFEQYFNEKYELSLVQPEKPLLEVKKISSRIDCTHPKIIAKPFDDTPSILPLSKRQMQLKNGDFLEHLIPELVTKRHFPATLWLKATTLPTILHRFSSMQLANELRHKICVETKINNIAPPQGKWKRLEVESTEIQVCESKPLPSSFFEESAMECSLSEPPDLDHDIDSLCLLDVVQYHKLEMKENDTQMVYKCEWSKIELAPVPETVFNRLKGMAVSDDGECQGPELVDVLNALTGASAGDVISLERLETLGDSFLKFAVSTYMYLKYPTMDEGKLTMIKGKMISNRNLYYCGKVINLGGKMKVHPFAPQSDWTPPGFSVPTFLKEKLNSLGGITKNILFQLAIPERERRSGHLSRDTKSDIVNFLNESQTNNMIGSTSTTLEALLGTQSVPDKSVADCVEALIGAWLVSGGGAAALRLLGWFGIFPHGRDGPAGTWQELVGEEALNMGKRGVIKDQTDYDIIGGVVDWGPNAQKNTIQNISEKMSKINPIQLKPDDDSGMEKEGGKNQNSKKLCSDRKPVKDSYDGVQVEQKSFALTKHHDAGAEVQNLWLDDSNDTDMDVDYELSCMNDTFSDSGDMNVCDIDFEPEEELDAADSAESEDIYSFTDDEDPDIQFDPMDLTCDEDDEYLFETGFDDSDEYDGSSNDDMLNYNHAENVVFDNNLEQTCLDGEKTSSQEKFKISRLPFDADVKKFFGHVNIKKPVTSICDLETNGNDQQASDSQNTIDALLSGTNQLEESLHYKFKNKSLLLQAITHASYSPNKFTECYQRLEFLGDAVLDFLITCHIYETAGKLNPGQLTDLRSALVNNITFASLVVRHGLHRHLLYLSPSLMEAIDSFVEFQLQRGNVVTEDCLVLMEEEECCLAESVEVPKALGDVMESLAGAIFLDSGLSLTTVWQVFYPMMKTEIEAFTKKVPKQPVRELLETNAKVQFMPTEEVKPAVVGDEVQRSGMMKVKVMVPVKITDPARGQERTFFGFGENKSLAKRAAAKLALRAMGKGNNPVYNQGDL